MKSAWKKAKDRAMDLAEEGLYQHLTLEERQHYIRTGEGLENLRKTAQSRKLDEGVLKA
jgi:hypothetical protein